MEALFFTQDLLHAVNHLWSAAGLHFSMPAQVLKAGVQHLRATAANRQSPLSFPALMQRSWPLLLRPGVESQPLHDCLSLDPVILPAHRGLTPASSSK